MNTTLELLMQLIITIGSKESLLKEERIAYDNALRYFSSLSDYNRLRTDDARRELEDQYASELPRSQVA